MAAYANTIMMSTRRPLQNQRFEVIVIGGGISGVAIARECARGGRPTLLVEQHDFAAGTTSRSTRIIHGGLRYLEQGDILQVRESLRERRRLLGQYPHLVRPLEFLLALDDDSNRSALAVHTGLWLYRRLGGSFPGREQRDGRAALERLLDVGRHFSIFSFEDAQCEFPERLVAQWLREAMDAGCLARNHTQVLAVVIQNGRATGALLRDCLSGQEQSVESSWVINATGPWADRVCQSSGVQTGIPMVSGVRGSHVVVPRFAGAPDAAVYAEAIDGRPVFIIPWNQQILVGTTEVLDQADPTRAQPSPGEINYLLSTLHRLFPGVGMSAADVHYAFAGVRPLPYSPDSNLSAVPRRHYFHDHAAEGAAQLISVLGGKLTTAGAMARECAAKIGVPAVKPLPFAMACCLDLDALLNGFADEVADASGMSKESAGGVVEWHGKQSLAVAHMARRNPELRAVLCPHTNHVVAEAVHAFENECAVTLADVLLRRVPVALGPCWSPECSREAGARIAAAMGWSERRAAQELENFETERGAFLRKLSNMGIAEGATGVHKHGPLRFRL